MQTPHGLMHILHNSTLCKVSSNQDVIIGPAVNRLLTRKFSLDAKSVA